MVNRLLNVSLLSCVLVELRDSTEDCHMTQYDLDRETGLIALPNLSSWCRVMVERLFLAVPRGSLQFVIVVFPDHTHLLFFKPSSEYFTDRSKTVLLLWIVFVSYASC